MTCTLVVKLILPTGCFVSRSSCHTMARVSPETFNMGQLIFWQAKKVGVVLSNANWCAQAI